MPKGHFKRSPEHNARNAAAQRARHARGLSPEHRAALSAGNRRRWAAMSAAERVAAGDAVRVGRNPHIPSRARAERLRRALDNWSNRT